MKLSTKVTSCSCREAISLQDGGSARIDAQRLLGSDGFSPRGKWTEALLWAAGRLAGLTRAIVTCARSTGAMWGQGSEWCTKSTSSYAVPLSLFIQKSKATNHEWRRTGFHVVGLSTRLAMEPWQLGRPPLLSYRLPCMQQNCYINRVTST